MVLCFLKKKWILCNKWCIYYSYFVNLKVLDIWNAQIFKISKFENIFSSIPHYKIFSFLQHLRRGQVREKEELPLSWVAVDHSQVRDLVASTTTTRHPLRMRAFWATLYCLIALPTSTSVALGTTCRTWRWSWTVPGCGWRTSLMSSIRMVSTPGPGSVRHHDLLQSWWW